MLLTRSASLTQRSRFTTQGGPLFICSAKGAQEGTFLVPWAFCLQAASCGLAFGNPPSQESAKCPRDQDASLKTDFAEHTQSGPLRAWTRPRGERSEVRGKGLGFARLSRVRKDGSEAAGRGSEAKTILIQGISSTARGLPPQFDPSPDRPEDESHGSGALNGRGIAVKGQRSVGRDWVLPDSRESGKTEARPQDAARRAKPNPFPRTSGTPPLQRQPKAPGRAEIR